MSRLWIVVVTGVFDVEREEGHSYVGPFMSHRAATRWLNANINYRDVFRGIVRPLSR